MRTYKIKAVTRSIWRQGLLSAHRHAYWRFVAELPYRWHRQPEKLWWRVAMPGSVEARWAAWVDAHSCTGYVCCVKNITLSVSEETLREVRKIAAERETTVNAMVREYLDGLAANKARRARLRRELARFAAKSRARVGPIVWSRDDTHER